MVTGSDNVFEGDSGLLPAKNYLEAYKQRSGATSNWLLYLQSPTILWWLSDHWSKIDPVLDMLALAGMAISTVIFLSGAANSVAMLTLWILYHSIVNVGQAWFSFGWESQLLETGKFSRCFLIKSI